MLTLRRCRTAGAAVVACAVVGLVLAVVPAPALAASAGSLDRSFAGNGKRLVDVYGPRGEDRANAIALQRGGRILLAGRASLTRTQGAGPPRMTLVRLKPRGRIDRDFGQHGRVTIRRFDRHLFSQAHALAVQTNDRILVGGERTLGMGLARLRSNGRLDPSFGRNGKVRTGVVGGDVLHRILDLAIQPDGRIVAVGVANDFDDSRGPSDLALARYRRNGELDPSFGEGGVVVTDFGAGDERTAGTAVAIQPDGGIVVAGEVRSNWIVARFLADGTPDPGFGEGGVTFTAPLAIGRAEGVEVLPDGRILTGGCEVGGSHPRFGLVRYLPDGTPDPTFGDGGAQHEANFPPRFRGGCAAGLALAADGRILLAGQAELPNMYSGQHFALARYLPNGSPDLSFGRDGMAVTGFRQRLRARSHRFVNDFATDLAVHPSGRILVGGYNRAVERSDAFAIAAFRP